MAWETLRVVVELPVLNTKKLPRYTTRSLAIDVQHLVAKGYPVGVTSDRENMFGRVRVKEFNRVMKARKR